MARVFNFSAGPAMLPESVLKKAADEMLDYQGTGMSVMEMSHRSKAYDAIHKAAEASLREIMNIPDDYAVMFLQGGASTQFSAVPLNMMSATEAVDVQATARHRPIFARIRIFALSKSPPYGTYACSLIIVNMEQYVVHCT